MADRAGAVQQMPCPDCGSPVRPDRDQLCPTCGYPLMFLRAPAGDDARAVPRSPDERADDTGMVAPGQRIGDTRQFPAATYGGAGAAPRAATGQPQCPTCGYPNEPARIRCERCGYALRPARPQAVVLGPPPVAQPSRRWPVWLVVLVVLAVLSVLSAVVALLWDPITAAI
jgi:predicted amidophosphoribosyltransferase